MSQVIISIASGKGGTGKTTVATSLALSIGKAVQFLDCDVEEPNAHIFLKPKIAGTEKITVLVPEVDEQRCDFCGQCAEVCEYNAIVAAKNKVLIFPELCHSCGGCVLFCPRRALFEVEREIGQIETGDAGGIGFVAGRLNVGEAKSVPLVAAVKNKTNPGKAVIIDAAPGTSCPVIAAIKGSDYCILVTEATPFGLSDLKLAVGAVRKMAVPFGVIVNKYDKSFADTDNFCARNRIPVLLKIPEERKIAEAYSRAEDLLEVLPEYKSKFIELFERIKK